MHSTSVDAQILARRLSTYLRRQGSAKQLALRIDCDERTARNLLGGFSWPIARHWWSIWVEFGDDVIEAVFHPEQVEARLAVEAARRDAAKRARIASASLEGRSFRVGDGLDEASGEDGRVEVDGPPNLDLFEEVQ